MALTDAELLNRAVHGGEQAFHELVDRYGDELYRLALVMLRRPADAEDVLQETLLGAYKSMGRFEGRSSVRTWLTRILMNQVAMRRRDRSRHAALSGNRDEPLATAARPDTTSAASWRMDLDQALDGISVEHRDVIVMREVQGLSYEEIAQVLSIPRGTVESRLHRARRALRDLLGDYKPQAKS